MDKISTYDISKKQQQLIKWREAKRQELRNAYLKQVQHPTKSKLTLDEGIVRFATARLTHEYQLKPTFRNALFSVGTALGSIILLSLYLTKSKENREHLYRTGQVSYADRDFKFQ